MHLDEFIAVKYMLIIFREIIKCLECQEECKKTEVNLQYLFLINQYGLIF